MAKDRYRAIAGTLISLSAALIPIAAAAQASRDDMMAAMRDCAKVSQLEARAACYDAIVAKSLPSAERTMPPIGPQPSEEHAAVTPAVSASSPQRQASAPDRSRQSQHSATGGPAAKRLVGAVTAVEERGPGVLLITLENGTTWEFADTAPASYREPERGSLVEIERGALGATRLRYDRQLPMRVRQVR